MKVWFKLDDKSEDSVVLQEDADVADLRHAVKDLVGDYLPCAALDLKVLTTTSDEPLNPRLRIKDAAQDVFILKSKTRETKRIKKTFDVASNLVATPLEVRPPAPSVREPAFVSSEDWCSEVEAEILVRLDEADLSDGLERVPPMAVVRCSRGGKTRALKEIARMMFENKDYRDPIAVLMISFNDNTDLYQKEQEDPLQAILRRIAFVACRERSDNEEGIHVAFKKFLGRDEYYDPEEIIEWLADHRVILIIDEINKLLALTDESRTKEAHVCGEFIKDNFLRTNGRYFVFSSHVLSTISAFGEFVAPVGASFRDVVLQELPLVDNLSAAMESLNASLNGAREAIYFRLMPGMIFEKGRGKHVGGKREKFLNDFVETSSNKEDEFKGILRSLVDGNLSPVPKHLHSLLDSCSGPAVEKRIRWVPFHFEYVMMRLRDLPNEAIRIHAATLEELCKQLLSSKEPSGDGWEGLFAMFLLARSIANLPDDFFLPQHWFAKGPVSVKFNPYSNPQRSLSQCKSWEELKEGIDASEDRAILVLYPFHAQFLAYDAVVVFSEKNEFTQIYGYQLKEGTADSKQPLESAFANSFVIKGSPLDKTMESHGWIIPNAEKIEGFFGYSGKHWTPQEWKWLESTVRQSHQN